MRKYSALILLTILFFFASTAKAADADQKGLFEALRCNICHKADAGKAFPSIKEIAIAYNGDKEKLAGYLQGKNDPIVNQEKGKSMEKYLEKSKALSTDELNSLVDFILSHKE